MTFMEPCFAFCYSQIVPASGIEWQEHSTIDPPRPPIGWRKTGFGQGWHGWRAGKIWPLSAEDITPRRATSIIWRQPQQCFWIAPIDYTTTRGELDPVEDWSHLYFHDLGLETDSQRGLFKLLGHGTERQLPLACPEKFDEFLPKHCFRGEEKKPCHLVGDLSLMLALHALVPEQEDNINNHIREYFFQGNNSSLQSCRDHNQWEAMDRCRYPGRALVMQTGVLHGIGSSEKCLEEWERGERGPMTSSRCPTRAERQQWGLLDQRLEAYHTRNKLDFTFAD